MHLELALNLIGDNASPTKKLNEYRSHLNDMLGDVFMVLKQPDRARSCYLAASSIAPASSCTSFIKLGCLCLDNFNQLAQARIYFLSALERDSKIAAVNQLLALSLSVVRSYGSLQDRNLVISSNN